MKKNRKNRKRFQLARASVIALILVAIFGFAIGYLANHPLFLSRQDNRGKASVPSGKTTFLVTPASTAIVPGEKITLTLAAYIPLRQEVDGLQAVIRIDGTLPADIQFTPHVPAGLTFFTASAFYLENAWELKFAYTETNLGIPYVGQGLFTMGEITFTAPLSGMVNLTYDPVLSKIMEHGTMLDILTTPPSYTYSVAVDEPVSTPVAEPTPTLSLKPTKKPKVTPVLPNSAIFNKFESTKN